MDSIRHPSRVELAHYAGRKLPAAELLAVDDHLLTCADCRAIVSESLSAGRLQLDDSEAHLSYEELEALVDGAPIADRELHEQHLHDCPMCSSELRDLRTIKEPRPTPAVIPMKRPRWRIPAGAAIAAGIVTAVVISQRHEPTPPANNAVAPATTIRDGARTLALDQQGRIIGAPFDPSEANAVAAALRSGAIPVGPGVRTWSRKQEALLGSTPASEPAVIAPVAETVESDRPLFRWQPVPRASVYRLEVYDSSFNQAGASGELTSAEWRPDTPLPRGQSYSWIVSARVGANQVRFPQPPAPEAKFDVLAAPAAAEMDRARQSGSLLLLAVVAGRHGLWTEARTAVDELARLNPSSTAIQALRQSVQISSAAR